MDLLRPKLQYIDGICYRINPGSECLDFDEGAPQPYYEFDSECSGLVEPECEEDYDVKKDQNGRFITSFQVPRIFFSYIIGCKGATRRRLEGDTRTTITVPKVGCAGDIVITGFEKKSVCSARNRVNMLVMSAKKKQKPTHFLSLPLDDDIFVQKYNQFKKDVIEICPDLDEGLFICPGRLHLTICVLKLFDNVEREKAKAALNHCHQNIISQLLRDKKGLRVRMQGLAYMNDDPSAVNVLYAKVLSVSDPSLLQNLADAVCSYFIQEGLAEENRTDKRVLIHATLMNTAFLQRGENVDNKSFNKKFDASTILELFKDYNFGEACISRIDVSTLHTASEDGYWQATASVDLFKF